ncbi:MULTISPECIES: DNA polymerase beta superfamily protein [Clostridia]|uniref:nucleotidyltransferase domain-containing protein n=2 Tax=Bacillota TaxID=1239 RepID=UPI001D01961A|nr:nucleotidyltransferase domain-containing protein [Blautia faecis]MCB5434908.1 nucleotidyltransferase domain-containing protein [Blautia faecis]MCG4846556.1 nucleotidyltransferase domain-containing protein [Blautia faecis]
MTVEEIREKLKTSEYDFLRNNKHLGSNIILLGLGGSYSYGMNIEGKSDIDIRGVALNSKEEILLLQNFGQIVDENTDTTIYSFNKMVNLLCKANPNVMEQLGLNTEHYLYIHPIGQVLLNNSKLFLSKRAVYSFAGYAKEQLKKMDNKSSRSFGEDYTGIGRRNRYAAAHNKLGKYMAHLIRLYYMCFDILENQKIITYREKEHDLLMNIRNGEYLDKNQQPISSFYDLLSELEKRLEYDEKNTSLPETPDYQRINEFRMFVNEKVVTGKIEKEN